MLPRHPSFLSSDLVYAKHSVVETTGARLFGLEESEVMERRRYVGHVRREIEVCLACWCVSTLCYRISFIDVG